MTNALSPDRMTAAERLDDVAGILAAGFMRMRSRKSSSLSVDGGESFLDFPPDRSGHAEHRDGKGDPA